MPSKENSQFIDGIEDNNEEEDAVEYQEEILNGNDGDQYTVQKLLLTPKIQNSPTIPKETLALGHDE